MTLGCHPCHLGQQKWAWVCGWASPKRGGPLSQEAQDPPWACLHAVHQHLQGILPCLPYPEPWVALKCVPRAVRPHGVVTKRLSGLWLPTRLHPEINITCPGSIHPQKAESQGEAQPQHSVTLGKSLCSWSLSFLICGVGIIQHHSAMR